MAARIEVKMESDAPVQKVVAAGLGAALATVLVWLLGLMKVPVPPEVAGALATVLSFVSGYLTPPGANERVVVRTPRPPSTTPARA